MANKKINPEENPEKFIEHHKNDYENSINQFRELIIFKLYNESFFVPANLRNKIAKTTIELNLLPSGDNSDFDEMLNNDIGCKLAILATFKKNRIICDYKLQNEFVGINGSPAPEEMIFADIKYKPSIAIAYYEKSKQLSSGNALQFSEPKFNKKEHIITWNIKKYTFRERNKNQNRIKLFDLLWDDRLVMNNNKIEQAGKTIPIETAATIIKLIDSSQIFFRSDIPKPRVTIRKLIKDINTNLRRAEMPIRICKGDDLQIVVKL